MDVRLSDRLKTIADLVPIDARIVDVGTDHALLPAFLVTTGRVEVAIASDIVPGPVEAARKTIQLFGLADVVSVRLGPGLTTVSPGEVDTALIAGMGGGTIVEVLEESPQVVDRLTTCVLQPMNASAQLRRFLYHQHWHLNAENVVTDEGRLYEVVSVCRNGTDTDSAYQSFQEDEIALDCAFHFGPLNLRRADAQVRLLVEQTTQHWREILQQMEAGRSPLLRAKMEHLTQRLTLMTSWLTHNA